MKKAEALTVLHELKDAFQESLPVDAISLDRFPPPQSEDFVIRLKCDISSDSRLTIISVISKYNLIMKQENNPVVIYTP